jgi:hypothetical protein
MVVSRVYCSSEDLQFLRMHPECHMGVECIPECDDD